MTLGTGIFLSSIFLGLIALYIATKDRWKWKKLVLWSLGCMLGLVAILGAGFGGYAWYESRPFKQTQFAGISLGASKADVKFAKGEPIQGPQDDQWRYTAGTGSDPGMYLIGFDNDKVRYIVYYGPRLSAPSIQGLSVYASLDEIEKKFGKPTLVSSSKDGLRRWYSFGAYNVAALFGQGEVAAHGIYDSSGEPLRFKEEAEK